MAKFFSFTGSPWPSFSNQSWCLMSRSFTTSDQDTTYERKQKATTRARAALSNNIPFINAPLALLKSRPLQRPRALRRRKILLTESVICCFCASDFATLVWNIWPGLQPGHWGLRASGGRGGHFCGSKASSLRARLLDEVVESPAKGQEVEISCSTARHLMQCGVALPLPCKPCAL